MSDPFHIGRDGPLLLLRFGAPARNDALVRFVAERLAQLSESGELEGGGIVGIKGPASLPVVVTIAEAVLHRFAAVAVFDPKLDRFVVAVSHDPDFVLGQLLTEQQLRHWDRQHQEDPR